MIKEHSIELGLKEHKGDVNSKMEVFYNPLMASNRNISITLLNSLRKENMNLALALAGSGVRALRFLNELEKSRINAF